VGSHPYERKRQPLATRIFGPSKGNRRPTQVAPSKTPVTRPTAQKGGGGNKAAGSVEPTAANTPTVSVSPSGEVTTEHFVEPSGPSKAQVRQKREAHVAAAEARRSRQRVRKVRSYVRTRDKELAPKREVKVSKGFVQGVEKKQNLDKPVTVAEHKRSLPGATTKKTVPVAEHARATPRQQAISHEEQTLEGLTTLGPKLVAKRAHEYVDSQEAAGKLKPELKGTPEERQEAREKVRAAKKAVRASGVPQSTRIGMIETPEQEQNLRTVLSTGKKMGASRKELLAATETGLVESYGFKNLHEGDSSSEGWRQELRTLYPEPTNVKQGAKNFFEEAKTDPTIPGGGGETAGQLAQTVQGSAFPERYEEHRGEAAAILNAFEGSKPSRKALKNLVAAKKEAKELGLKVGGGGVGKPPKPVVTKFKQIQHAAAELESKNLPYSWGGGHDPNFSPGGEGENGGPGYDCSGAVSFVLHQAGVLSEPLTSGSMGSVLKPGPGAVTVFYNAEHTFMKIGNEYWGTSVGDSGAGGIGKHPTPSADYLAQYNVGHVPGLGRKQALQLGFEPGSLTTTAGSSTASAFPGMEFSEGGTTATIEQGQGAKVPGKAGFSKKPIELTPFQKLTKRVRKLQSLGVDVALPGGERPSEKQGETKAASPLHKQLAELEKRYSIGAV
jgi:cell wall-associated NlpC family hydrolase